MVVSAAFGYLTMIHDDDLVTIANGAETMGDDDSRGTALAYVLHNIAFHLSIEGTGSFIHDKQYRFTCQCRGYLHALTLSAREVASSFDKARVETSGS